MFFNRQIKTASLLFALTFCYINYAFAASTDWHKNESKGAETKLIASFYEENGSKKLIAGIHFKIGEGWKIYGNDSQGMGLVPSFDLSGSKNYSTHEIFWPKAEEHEEKIGDETFRYSAYHNELIIPVIINLQNNENPTELTLALNFGLCKEVCVPVSEKFSLEIPQETDAKVLTEIQKFYPAKLIAESQAQSNFMPSYPTIFYIFFALLGGLILNVMPCVLPVLSIKLLSIIQRPEARLARIRYAFFATTLGILFCFVIFALLAFAIKFTGNELGWGLQFQNPYFLIFLTIIVTFITANLIGLFEVTYEQIITTFLHKKIERNERRKNIFVPNFLSGILATLLATPCSAPFLGSAISFALIQDFSIIFIIFLAIGVGFAAPYIILFFSPKLINLLPKPGMWMVKIKHVLALFMAATLLWLLYVLSNNLDLTATILILLLVIAIFFSLKIRDRIIKYAVVALLAGSAFALPKDFQKDYQIVHEAGSALWQEFDEAEIYRQVREGKTVVVDVTADWCITCKFNKLNVLQSKEIVILLKRGEIIGMRGDITKPNPQVMEFMRKHNRFAIPFNVVYGPNAASGLLASELLNQGALLKLIKQANDRTN